MLFRSARPFLCSLATPAVHAPHHAPAEWIDRFAGAFDGGWDALRDEIFERQLALGVIPEGTRLTERPEQIPAWDDYPERYRPVASRLMECFAGFLAHTDAQIGRVIDAIEELGLGVDTLVIYITGDNGASAEGTVHGAWSAPSFQNGVHEEPEWLLAHLDDFGTAACENHYNVGWAWALDAPFQWMKQVASHFGGTRNGMAISWPRRIADAGGLRTQFHHVVDIAPTIYAAAGIEAPGRVNGIEQMAIDGVAMDYTFAADGPSRRTTQYFEILGNRAIYHDGWVAACFHGRLPWIRLQGYEFDGPQEVWELYDVRTDFSQSVDLADQHPEILAELQRIFHEEAQRHGVYPLRDVASPRHGDYSVPSPLGDLQRMTYTTAHVRMPESAVVNLKNCSWRITAEITVDGAAEGVIACQGGNMAGWSLYLDAGRPTYLSNLYGQHLTSVAAPAPLGPGAHTVVVEFDSDGGFGAGGEAVVSVDGTAVAHARIERTVPLVFSRKLPPSTRVGPSPA